MASAGRVAAQMKGRAMDAQQAQADQQATEKQPSGADTKPNDLIQTPPTEAVAPKAEPAKKAKAPAPTPKAEQPDQYAVYHLADGQWRLARTYATDSGAMKAATGTLPDNVTGVRAVQRTDGQQWNDTAFVNELDALVHLVHGGG